MAEVYMEEEQLIASFAQMLTNEHFEAMVEDFLDDPDQVFYTEEGELDGATMMKADYFMRSAQGEFCEAEQYLTEVCIRIVDDEDLRDRLIEEFELDREYIESEL